MQENINNLMLKLYEKFRGYPNINSIVRNNQQNDAFTLVILKLLYSQDMNIEIEPSNIDQICQYIVAPKDDGIDLFIERESGDEYYYDIIQAKYSELDENTIKQCFQEMKDTIKDYLKEPKSVTTNLRNVISNTNFCFSYKNNITYYVVHNGTIKYSSKWNDKDNKVITSSDLEVILYSINNPDKNGKEKVPYEELSSDSFNNFMLYQPFGNDQDKGKKEKDKALLCSIRGYDLACLCEKYNSSSKGRNILFGENLRESLASKSKTLRDMFKTIDDEPERFWHYNNGITIIAEEFNLLKNDNTGLETINLKNFSIINGAQTTSSLFEYLKDARINYDKDKEEKLKRVYVLARLMEVTNNNTFGDNIAIYNNSQNAITSRDMVSRNEEQRKLQNKFFQGDKPNIFIYIKRGEGKPSYPRIEKHQEVTNEELAQLAFAAFLQEPFSAKNKKATLFSKDINSKKYRVNSDYDKIFNYISSEQRNVKNEDIDYEDIDKEGILFSKDKYDVDELLFIKFLYRAARTELKNHYENAIEKIKAKINSDIYVTMKNNDEESMLQFQKRKEISNTCYFYCVTLYFNLRELYAENTDGVFDYDKFYGNGKEPYKENIIKDFASNFLEETINIIETCMNAENNVGNWVRRASSQQEFLGRLRKKATSMSFKEIYRDFVNNYKTIQKK